MILKNKDIITFENKENYEFYNLMSKFASFKKEPFYNNVKKINLILDKDCELRFIKAYVYEPDIYKLFKFENLDINKSLNIDIESPCKKSYFYNGNHYFIQGDNDFLSNGIRIILSNINDIQDFENMNEHQFNRFVEFCSKYGCIQYLNYIFIFAKHITYLLKNKNNELYNLISCFEQDDKLFIRDTAKILVLLYSIESRLYNLDKIYSLAMSDNFNMYEKKFLYWQLVARYFVDFSLEYYKTFANLKNLYSDIYKLAEERFGKLFNPIDRLQYKKNRILLLTTQFLSFKHAPTRRAIDYAINFMDYLGYEVMILNTSDAKMITGLPYYMSSEFYFERDYNELDTLKIDDKHSVKFLQLGVDHIDVNEKNYVIEIKKAVKSVCDFAPMYVLQVGASCIFADLLAKYIPVATIPCSFDAPIMYNGYPIIAREVEDRDIQILENAGISKNRIIESCITYKIPGTSNIKIDKKQSEFVIVIVSNRLESEFDLNTLKICEEFCNIDDSIVIKFFGTFVTKDNNNAYNKFLKLINENSKYPDRYFFEGYQNDILSAYTACDVYYNPKRHGGGSSVSQAMLMGLPVVCHKFGDGSYTLGRDRCFDSDEDIINEIKKLFEDKEYYESSKQYSLKKAEFLYDTKSMIIKLDKDIRKKISDKVLYDIEID
ncbi:glycosyltransferase, group 1 family protein [Peptoanaerobacter stomatis]|uniref:Glycosyltransferase, group 1 family protein n=1 Tax=Peptoanaerobacter stomatis TaxID=796937 RepID=J6HE96_9FIRM|nr:glycosyltransferase [Peptoanaerobacter stomatis]EJU21078.1 glycosyltransferase, group 1 family protein [Peptoanaerobacter stomatis]